VDEHAAEAHRALDAHAARQQPFGMSSLIGNRMRTADVGSAAGPMYSDARAKEAAHLKGQAEGMMQAIATQHRAQIATGPAVRRVASGTAANGYNTELTTGAEQAFPAWAAKVAPGDDGRDYDYRGAFAAGEQRSGNGHLPDTFKKPNHETFSNESQYAAERPEIAGHWNGDRYEPKGPPAWLRQEMETQAQAPERPQAQSLDERSAALKAADWSDPAFRAELARAAEAQGGPPLYSDMTSKGPVAMPAQRMPSVAIPTDPIRPAMMQRPMYSDAAAKRAAFIDGVNHADQMQQTGTAAAPPSYMPNTPTRDGSVRQMETRGVRTAAGKEATRMQGAGAELERRVRDNPMAAANRALAAEPYVYKDEFAGRSGQRAGEVNVGPMAQRMAADPVARTVVKPDATTGMLTLDRDKLQKVTAGGVAELQRQNDEQDRKLSLMAQRLQRARR
jgi:hypothetical protein